ncbi:helix-turn-helix transcriptional regulator [bacterium]|nr:helix-turn-helix transcriptional regulator [bacterium]
MDKNIDVKKIFGYNLRILRESKHLTQEQLAELLNLQTYQTINRIENGKSFITSDLFEKMCIFFDVEPHIFFTKSQQTYTPESLDYISQINYKLDEIYNIVSKIKK